MRPSKLPSRMLIAWIDEKLLSFQFQKHLLFIVGIVVLCDYDVKSQEPTAASPPPEQVESDKGIAASRQEEWEIAIRHFEEARKLAGDIPSKWGPMLFNQGLCESHIAGRELRAV